MKELLQKIVDILLTDVTELPSKLHKRKDTGLVVSHPAPGIIGVATHKGPKMFNEDVVLEGSSWGINFLILADGLGGCSHGGNAAKLTANTFHDEIEKIIKTSGKVQFNDIEPIYYSCAAKIKKHSRNGKGWKTTVICVVENQDDLLITYLGDGQVYLVRGDVESGIPLMVGHRVNGLLGGVVGPEITARPVIIRISKAFTKGEIIIAGTDGIFNPELKTAKPELLMELLAYIREKIRTDSMNNILRHFIDELYAQDLLNDNASLGVIITSRAHTTILNRR